MSPRPPVTELSLRRKELKTASNSIPRTSRVTPAPCIQVCCSQCSRAQSAPYRGGFRRRTRFYLVPSTGIAGPFISPAATRPGPIHCSQIDLPVHSFSRTAWNVVNSAFLVVLSPCWLTAISRSPEDASSEGPTLLSCSVSTNLHP